MEWSEFIFHKEEEKDVREENVGEIGGASSGGEFAENGNDDFVRQGIEQATLSRYIRRIPVISPSLHNSHVEDNSR